MTLKLLCESDLQYLCVNVKPVFLPSWVGLFSRCHFTSFCQKGTYCRVWLKDIYDVDTANNRKHLQSFGRRDQTDFIVQLTDLAFYYQSVCSFKIVLNFT